MKNTGLLLLTLLFATYASTQIPQALNYQAIARNSTGQIIPSQNIGIRFSITDATGNTVFYQETHNTVTNAFGLFTLAIGKGTAVSGTVPAIDWSIGGDKYLKVEIAPQGGTNYTMQGITQLLSVPYSLYAEKTKLIGGNAITITNGNTINSNYQAGNAITITGNTIAANYQAGAGINITGNTISATAGNSWLLNGNSGITASNFLGTINNENLRFRTFNQERMIIDVNGNVGIRTSAPNYLLSIQDEVHSSGSIDKRMLISLNNTSTDVDALAGIRFEANGGVPAPTNFGILAIASPAYNVVPSNTNSVILQSYTRDGLNLISSPYNVYDAAYGKIKFFTGTSNIGTLNIERMRIDSTGFVGINTQTPSAILHTNGTVRFQNLASGSGNILVIDNNGNVFRASQTASRTNADNKMIESLQNELNQTKKELAQIKLLISKTQKEPDVSNKQLNGKSNDIYLENVHSGVIMKSPNGHCWRMTVSDSGTPVFTAVTCP